MDDASSFKRAGAQDQVFNPALYQQQAIGGSRRNAGNASRKTVNGFLFLAIAAVLGTSISHPVRAQSADEPADATSPTPDLRPLTPEQIKAYELLEAARSKRTIDYNSLEFDGMANGLLSTAIGPGSSAEDFATAVGVASSAGPDGSAYGDGSNASGNASTAIGAYSVASGSYSTAIGNGAQATNGNSTAVGQWSTASGYDSIAIGEASQATNDYSLASGGFSKASGTQSSAYGYFSKAEGSHSTASGDHSSASGANSTALGSQAVASASNSVALGQGSVADQANTVSVGSAQNQRRITNVAAGTQGTDAVNVSQLHGDIGKLQNQFNSGISNVQNWTRSYVDQKTQGVARAAYSGIAGATALTMIPELDTGKRFAVGVGTGHYKGYSAGALGISARVSDNIKIKAGFGFSRNDNTAGAGASYQW